MTALTEGIVLRKIKYGDSSQIVHVFTQQFGLQSYMVKGLGKTRRSNARANLLRPSALLELSVYYRENKKIKHLKEVRPAYYCQTLNESVLKNSVAIFCMEVLHNFLFDGDIQKELFEFSRAFLINLDKVAVSEIANYPIYFLIQTGRLSGYQIHGEYNQMTPYLDIAEGCFSNSKTSSEQIKPEVLNLISRLNTLKSLQEIKAVRMNHKIRQVVLKQMVYFFRWHVPRFKALKSVDVLSVILS